MPGLGLTVPRPAAPVRRHRLAAGRGHDSKSRTPSSGCCRTGITGQLLHGRIMDITVATSVAASGVTVFTAMAADHEIRLRVPGSHGCGANDGPQEMALEL
jgi:hypothetical protein